MPAKLQAESVSDRRLGRATRGAVFVEKLIAYVPLMSLFFLTFQLAEVLVAKLVVQRAASAAARC